VPILNWYIAPGSKNFVVTIQVGINGHTSIASTTFAGFLGLGKTKTSVRSIAGRLTVKGES
jgi:hypothetical protein